MKEKDIEKETKDILKRINYLMGQVGDKKIKVEEPKTEEHPIENNQQYKLKYFREHKGVYIIFKQGLDKENQEELEEKLKKEKPKHIIFNLNDIKRLIDRNLKMIIELGEKEEKNIAILVNDPYLKTSISLYDNKKLKSYVERGDSISNQQSFHKVQD